MIIYGQTLRVFKHENNECIRKGENTKLHKIKFVAFLDLAYVVLWRVIRHESRDYDVIMTWIVTKYAPHL